MTVTNILVYLALIAYILYRRVQGQPVKEGRRLFALPVLLVVLGFGDVTQGASASPHEATLTVIAAVICLGLGLIRGRVDKLSERNGTPFVQWGAVSVVLFVGNLLVKLLLDVIGLAAGSSGSTVGKSLVLTFGLTLLGEAIVLRMRTGSLTAAPGRRHARQAASRASTGWAVNVTSKVPAAASGANGARDLGDALSSHHERHEQRREERHHRRHNH
jgi:hypothetical protein